MRWYAYKVWRIALSRSRGGIMIDQHGRWRHVFGPLWWLTDGPEYFDAVDVDADHFLD